MITGLIPRLLDLADQTLLVLLGALLGFFTFASEVGLQTVDIPALVRSCNVAVPVVLHKILKIFPVCGCRVRDVMVGQPPLKLSLMPLVVC